MQIQEITGGMAGDAGRNAFTAIRHDRLTAWACVNAILAYDLSAR